MRTRGGATTEELGQAIRCLPRRTRIAMLDAIGANEIIVGAYAHDGGVCPMLAAHRAGGRTNFSSFARAWDRFAFRGTRRGTPRRATERELLTLKTHLEASLLENDAAGSTLPGAIEEHEALKATLKPRPGDPYLGQKLRGHPGWAWLRVVRRYDEYERALDALDAPSPGATLLPV
jgi:hypothetical protein